MKSGKWSNLIFVSSSSDSLEEPEGGRRAGGSLSPKAMVRVGGGRWTPNVLRSVRGIVEGAETGGEGSIGVISDGDTDNGGGAELIM